LTRGSIIGRLTTLALAAAALAAVPEATAHGDGGAPLGYSSAVTGIEPEVDGLSLEILDADDRLLLVNHRRLRAAYTAGTPSADYAHDVRALLDE